MKTRTIFGEFRMLLVSVAFAAGTVNLLAQSAAISSVAPEAAMKDFQPVGKPHDIQEVEPLVDWMPIWGREAREQGYDLPLPFGVGLTYTYINQNVVVSDVKIEGNPVNVNIRDAATETHTGVFRADFWLFPFMNLYGLVGYTGGETRPALVFSDGEVLESKVEYDRPSYGGGVTLAGGWKAYFITLDANYTTGDAITKGGGRIGDKPIKSFTFTPRFGIVFSSGRLGTGAIWIGGMYIDAATEIRGSIDLSENPILAGLMGQDTLNYSTRIRPKEEWNLLIGGNWQINKRWSVTAEVGRIMDRFHAIGSVMWRF